MSKNILFTSVGNLAFPLAANCLRESFSDVTIIGTDVRCNAHGLYYCDKGYIVDYRNNPNFLDEINQILNKENIDILYPLSTEDQNYFSEKKYIFEDKGVKVICSDFHAVVTVNNKYKLYEGLKKRGLNNPEYFKIEELADIEDLIGKIGTPFVIKPFVGKGGSDLYIVSKDRAILREDDRKFFLDYDQFIENRRDYINPGNTLICEYLMGYEYSVDTLSKEGKLFYGVVRKRYSSQGGLALEAEVVKNDEIMKLTKEIIHGFKLSYINNIQFKEDKNGIPKVMEVNPRIPGTLNLSVKASSDFISDSIRLVEGDKIEIPEVRYGLKILRYWDGVIIHKQDEKDLINIRGLNNE